MYTINQTQHVSTSEQGCIDLQGTALATLKGLLTFDALPSRDEVKARAEAIANLAATYPVAFQDPACGSVMPVAAQGHETPIMARVAMIGGAPVLMGPLRAALKAVGIAPVYAFSVRESVDEAMPDGSVKKVAVFRHKGFVPA